MIFNRVWIFNGACISNGLMVMDNGVNSPLICDLCKKKTSLIYQNKVLIITIKGSFI